MSTKLKEYFMLFFADCAQVVVPEASEQAIRFYKSGNWLWAIQQIWSLLIPALILFSGFSGKLASFASSKVKFWFFSLFIYLLLYTAITQLIDLPLDYYTSYIRMHAYNLSNQTVARWFANYGKISLVVAIGSIAFVWIFYLLLKKSPRRWWFYSSLAASALTFFTMFIQPLWIDPLFNHFGPMKNKELETQILQLAARAGIQDGRVFEVDKSQDTKLINAYVTGFGRSNRIVLWDTTLARMTPDQILFVMGHEMGHYVLHHVWWHFAYFTALFFALFYLTDRTGHWLLRRFHHRFGFSRLDNIASYPLLLLLLGLFLFLSAPLSNFVSRYMEHEADRFGLEITQNNQAAGEAFIALQQQNLANPRPGSLYILWRGSHPPLGERIDFSNAYCPWAKGAPLHYGSYFSTP